MDNMVERLAWVICRASGQRPNEVIFGSGWASHDGRSGSTVSQYAWQKHLPAAREVLTELRDPTNGMRAAMDELAGTINPPDIWDVAIAAALKGE
jgi:hypothetical protein